MKTDFNPVYPHFYEIFSKAQQAAQSRAIYFSSDIDLEEAKGKITGITTNSLNEEYLCFDSGANVRIDRIISINGIPGPAYDEYDNLSMACMACNFNTPS